MARTDWEAHNLADYRAWLNREQARDSEATLGERFAMAVNCKTKTELADMLETGKDEAAMPLLDYLDAAHDSLKRRLDLILCTYSRMAVCGRFIEARKGKRA
jgi:hypothetical protein